MDAEKRLIVIPKEKAVFWMDAKGNWNNEHGKFEHPKIMKHFHRAIRKDKDGYHVFQETEEFEERVYFNYEDTALFVFNIRFEKEATLLLLNTGAAIPLVADRLFIRNDQMYYQTQEHRIKFTEKALVKLAPHINEDG
ncbi:MAG: MFS transporter permease, partial [Desulfobacterales bacterium]|nr:MFS transporter permease [Desulfobacterales bacterium]